MIPSFVIGVALLGFLTGCDADESSQSPPPLDVSEVRRIFAEEDVPLKRPDRRAKTPPVVLLPADQDQFPFFVVSVYGPDRVTGDLGYVLTNRGYDIARVKNVVVAFEPKSVVASRVRAAVQRLPTTGSGRT